MRVARRAVPWWGLVTSATAPVLLVGGYVTAAGLQTASFDSAVETISALAGTGADSRWVMTSALVGLGLCHVGTAAALRPAAPAGRAVLGLGGVATVLVGALPLPVDGSSVGHTVAAGAAFAAMSTWPALAWRRDAARPPAPLALRRRTSVGAAGVLLGLLGWFAVELAADGGRVGLSERVAATAQALWPLAVVLSARSARSATSEA